jgi:hypothetical protein
MQQSQVSVQILHFGAMEITGPAGASVAFSPVPARYRYGPALAFTHSERDKKDALDNLHHFAGFVGTGNGNLIYRRRVDSHPPGCCVGSRGIPPDSGAQGYLVAPGGTTGSGLHLMS